MSLLIIDIDGVMTNGTKIYDISGTACGKNFCDQDFTGIKYLKFLGWKVCFLSGDKMVNQAMAHERKVDFHYCCSDTHDKVSFLEKLMKQYKIDNVEDVYFIGDDLYDVLLLQALPPANRWCPNDAADFVLDIANTVGRNGGEGVVGRFAYLHGGNEEVRYVKERFI